MRKPRSDIGKTHRRKRRIAQAPREIAMQISWPTNSTLNLTSLYVQERKWIDDVAALQARGKDPVKRTYYRNRWETLGEFTERIFFDWLRAHQLNANDYRTALPGQDDYVTQTAADSISSSLEDLLMQGELVRMAKHDLPPVPDGAITQIGLTYALIAMSQSILDLPIEQAIPWPMEES